MLATHRSELGRAWKLLLRPISGATCPPCGLPCYGGVKKIEMPVPFVHDLGVGPTHLTPRVAVGPKQEAVGRVGQ